MLKNRSLPSRLQRETAARGTILHDVDQSAYAKFLKLITKVGYSSLQLRA
jgi:hypothetical protein